MAAGKRLGTVKNAASKQSLWTMSRRLGELGVTRVVSGGGDTGRQTVALRRGAARTLHCDRGGAGAATRSQWSMPW
jgi:ribosomal protein S9